MTVSHCSIFEYTRRATSSSRASPHNLLHSPWLCLRAKLSVQVSTRRDACRRAWVASAGDPACSSLLQPMADSLKQRVGKPSLSMASRTPSPVRLTYSASAMALCLS